MSTEFLKEKISFYKEIQDFCTELFFKTYFELEKEKQDKIPKEHYVKVIFHYYPEFNSNKNNFVISQLSSTKKPSSLDQTFLNIPKNHIEHMGFQNTSGLFFSNIKKHSEKIDPKIYWRSFYALITNQGVILKAYSYRETSNFVLETDPYMWDNVNYIPFSETISIDNKNRLFSEFYDSEIKDLIFLQDPRDVKNIQKYQFNNYKTEFFYISSNMDISENKCIYVSSEIAQKNNQHQWFDFGLKHPKAFSELNSFMKNSTTKELKYYEEFEKASGYDIKKLKEKNLHEILFIRKINNISIIFQKIFNTQKYNFITSNIVGYFLNQKV